jgi:hypothetical protein
MYAQCLPQPIYFCKIAQLQAIGSCRFIGFSRNLNWWAAPRPPPCQSAIPLFHRWDQCSRLLQCRGKRLVRQERHSVGISTYLTLWGGGLSLVIAPDPVPPTRLFPSLVETGSNPGLPVPVPLTRLLLDPARKQLKGRMWVLLCPSVPDCGLFAPTL